MRPIISIKDGLVGNLTVLLFCLALPTLAVWLDYRVHGDVSLFTWVWAGFLVLFCYIPITSVQKPKLRSLVIEGDDLVWRIRDEGTNGTREERMPLRQIQALEFVIPRNVESDAPSPSCAELYFVSRQGGKRALPLDFFPGVYRDKIVAAIRERVAGVEVLEIHHEAA